MKNTNQRGGLPNRNEYFFHKSLTSSETLHQRHKKRRGTQLLPVSRASYICLASAHTSNTVTSRAPCAPITNACSMSAVFEGPEMNTP